MVQQEVCPPLPHLTMCCRSLVLPAMRLPQDGSSLETCSMQTRSPSVVKSLSVREAITCEKRMASGLCLPGSRSLPISIRISQRDRLSALHRLSKTTGPCMVATTIRGTTTRALRQRQLKQSSLVLSNSWPSGHRWRGRRPLTLPTRTLSRVMSRQIRATFSPTQMAVDLSSVRVERVAPELRFAST